MAEKSHTFPIPLPPDLAGYAEGLIKQGVYVDVADYVRDLMRRDRQAHYADMRRKIEEGWESARAGRLLDGEAVFKELDEYSRAWRAARKEK
jgi:putative addiction module CopG family antidote